WNVRQLQSVLKYALVQGSGDVLTLDSLPENLRTSPAPAGTGLLTPEACLAGLADYTEGVVHAGGGDIYRRVLLDMDRVVLLAVLRHVKGNQVKASELLGISRTTLRAKLRAMDHGAGRLAGPDREVQG